MEKKRKSNNSHGAVTVFLTLILVPCLIFTCAFGDISRVELSKSQSNAAADLALYSLMSNYDADLKEWYGLVASVQDIESFYDVTEQYFVGMMDAKGIDGTSSQLFSAYLSSLKNGGNYVDFLQVDTANSIQVGAATNGELGKNAALIEDGIVEFMKYRGPVEITANIIDRLNTLDVLGALNGANENQPIVEKKQEYTEAEGEMLEELLYSYIACVNYQNYLNAHTKLLKAEYQGYAEKLSMIRDDLQKVTELITAYYAYTDGIANKSGSFSNFPELPQLSESKQVVKYNGNGTYHSMSGIGAVVDDPDEQTFSITNQKLRELTGSIDSDISSIQTAVNNITNAVSGLTAPESGNSDINPALYCMKFQKAVSTSDLETIRNAGNRLMKAYAGILLAKECILPQQENVPEEQKWASKLETWQQSIESAYTNYLTYETATTQFERLLSDYKRVADTTVNYVIDRKYEFTSVYTNTYHGRASVTIGGFFDCVRSEFESLSTQLDAQIANIDLILNGGTVTFNGAEYTVPSLDSLKAAIEKSQNARNAWGAEAHSHGREGNEFVQQEQDEFDAVPDDVTGQVSSAQLRGTGKEEIEELRTRLQNIRAVYVGLQDAINGFTYGGEKVASLNRNNAIAAAKKQVPSDYTQVKGKLSENRTDAATYYRNLVSPLDKPVYNAVVITTGKTGNDPDLNQDPPELYYYMRQTISLAKLEEATSEKSKNDEKNSEYEDKAAKEAEASKGVEDKYLNDLGVNLESPYGGSGMDATTVITGLLGAVQKLVGGNFGEFRDQAYFCEYVMDMFSYSSYNNEGQYRLAADSGKILTLKDFNEESKSYGDSYIGTWETLDVQNFTGNVSLTNHQINSKNNRANLAEVEYILFGNASNEENLKSAYGSIFTIRESLNLISGFQNFYSVSTNTTSQLINGIATSIAGLTAGIVPAPLTKCILIGVLATVESSHDMARLKAGIPVAVYKTTDKNWWLKLSGENVGSNSINIDSVISGKGFAEPDDSACGIYYSEYLYLFLMMAANDSYLYEDMLFRTGDLIEANMRLGAGDSDFDLDKSVCYFTIRGTLEVKPLLITLPIVSNTVESDSYNQIREDTRWCTYEISLTRGYS